MCVSLLHTKDRHTEELITTTKCTKRSSSHFPLMEPYFSDERVEGGLQADGGTASTEQSFCTKLHSSVSQVSLSFHLSAASFHQHSRGTAFTASVCQNFKSPPVIIGQSPFYFSKIVNIAAHEKTSQAIGNTDQLFDCANNTE